MTSNARVTSVTFAAIGAITDRPMKGSANPGP